MIRLLHDLIVRAAEKKPENTAVLQGDQKLSYNDVLQKSIQLSRFLRNRNLAKGDRVCFYLEKRFEKVISIFGISYAGAVMVPIRRLAHANQAAYIIRNSGAKVVITTASRVQMLLDRIHSLPELKTIIYVECFESKIESAGVSLVYWNDIIDSSPAYHHDAGATEKDLAAILYTSGSTGMPKGVVLSHHNLIAGTIKVSEYLQIDENDRILSILTFGFDYGLNQLTTAFYCFAQIVLLDYLFPQDILVAVEKHQITGLAAVATTWLKLLKTSWEKSNIESLRYITNTGGSIPEKYVRELQKRLPTTKIFLMYGLTEAFRSTFLNPSLLEKYPTSIGKAIPGEEILVLDENDKPVNAGEVGELVHRGTLVSQGYWRDPELTSFRFRPNPMRPQEVSIPEMVVYSGDYVRIDAEGFLYFIGRKDEMIKCAGNRISPTEVEEILYNSGMVLNTVAFGIPDELFGETVCVVISPLPGAGTDINKIKKHCREMMPPYMLPEHIEIWEDMPCNENGKIDRAFIKKAIYKKLSIEEKVIE